MLNIPEGSSIVTAKKGLNKKAIAAYKQGDQKKLSKIIKKMPSDNSTKKLDGDEALKLYNKYRNYPATFNSPLIKGNKGVIDNQSYKPYRQNILGNFNVFKKEYDAGNLKEGDYPDGQALIYPAPRKKGLYKNIGTMERAALIPKSNSATAQTPPNSAQTPPNNTFTPLPSGSFSPPNLLKKDVVEEDLTKKPVEEKPDNSGLLSSATLIAKTANALRKPDYITAEQVASPKLQYNSQLPLFLANNRRSGNIANRNAQTASGGNAGIAIAAAANGAMNTVDANQQGYSIDQQGQQRVAEINNQNDFQSTLFNAQSRERAKEINQQEKDAKRDAAIATAMTADSKIDTLRHERYMRKAQAAQMAEDAKTREMISEAYKNLIPLSYQKGLPQ